MMKKIANIILLLVRDLDLLRIVNLIHSEMEKMLSYLIKESLLCRSINITLMS